MVKRKGIPVLVWFTEEEYSRLSAEAAKAGYAAVGDYVRELALQALESPAGTPGGTDVKALSESIAKRLERVIADLINPFTAKIDEVNRRVAELIEAVEAARGEAEAEQPLPQAGKAAKPARRAAATGRPTGLERLHDEGVVFSGDLQWLRDPERFFAKLKSEGAIVLDAAGEKVAVHPEFWEEFREAVESVGVRDLAEAATLVRTEIGGDRGARAARLLERLAKAGIVYYDEEAGHWVVKPGPEGDEGREG